jgi:hypothetical protein
MQLLPLQILQWLLLLPHTVRCKSLQRSRPVLLLLPPQVLKAAAAAAAL